MPFFFCFLELICKDIPSSVLTVAKLEITRQSSYAFSKKSSNFILKIRSVNSCVEAMHSAIDINAITFEEIITTES